MTCMPPSAKNSWRLSHNRWVITDHNMALGQFSADHPRIYAELARRDPRATARNRPQRLASGAETGCARTSPRSLDSSLFVARRGPFLIADDVVSQIVLRFEFTDYRRA